MANYSVAKGMPFKVKVIAGSTLELLDEEFEKVKAQVAPLVDAGIIVILEAPETKLTIAEIVAKVEDEAGVKLSAKMNKKELQEKALLLKVAV